MCTNVGGSGGGGGAFGEGMLNENTSVKVKSSHPLTHSSPVRVYTREALNA